LNQELNQIEQQAAVGLDFARTSLERFPDNLLLTDLFAFLNASLFYAQQTKTIIKERLNYLTKLDGVTDEEIKEAGEELSIELGRTIETKLRVISIIQRLEKLQ
jgi:hypothetical protein